MKFNTLNFMTQKWIKIDKPLKPTNRAQEKQIPVKEKCYHLGKSYRIMTKNYREIYQSCQELSGTFAHKSERPLSV